MTVEQVMGRVVEIGPPTEKKRLVKVHAEGREYPKSLRCWQANQDGSPSSLWPKVAELFENQRDALFIYKKETWEKSPGDIRTSNVITEIWPDETVSPGAGARETTPATSSPAPARITTGDWTPPITGGQGVAPAPEPSVPVPTKSALTLLNDIREILGVLEKMMQMGGEQVEQERGWADWTS